MGKRIKLNITKFVGNIYNNSFLKNSALIISGNVIGQILSIIFMPVKSRLYGPEFFGEFGVFTATINIINGIVCLGLVSAIVSPKEDQEASAIYKTCLISSSTFAILFIVIALLLAPIFKFISISLNYYFVCILMSIYLIINNFAAITYAWGNRQKAYKVLMYNPIIGSTVNFLVVLIFAFIGFKSIGLIAGIIISQTAILLHLLRHLNPLDFKHTFTDIKYVLHKYQDFPKYQMSSNFLKGFGTQFPIILMGTYFGAGFVGHYNMGQGLLYVPVTLVGSALGQVHFKQATDIYNDGRDVGEFTYKVVKGILLLSFVPLLICAVFGEWIFKLFLGIDWGLAGNIVQIRSFELLFVSMMFSVSYILVVLKRQNIVLVYTIATLIFSNLTVCVGGSYLNNDILTVWVLSIGSALLNFLFLFYAFSQTQFGTKKYVHLVLVSSTVFILIAIGGNLLMKGII